MHVKPGVNESLLWAVERKRRHLPVCGAASCALFAEGSKADRHWCSAGIALYILAFFHWGGQSRGLPDRCARAGWQGRKNNGAAAAGEGRAGAVALPGEQPVTQCRVVKCCSSEGGKVCVFAELLPSDGMRGGTEQSCMRHTDGPVQCFN